MTMQKAGCCGFGRYEARNRSSTANNQSLWLFEKSKIVGRWITVLIVLAPVAWATESTPDQTSPDPVINKGAYNSSYASKTQADQLQNSDTVPVRQKAAYLPLPTNGPIEAQPTRDDSVETAAMPSPVVPAIGAADSKSYGGFTLADLEAQVPRSKDGNFILNVPEIYYTAGDKEVQGVLEGQMIETIAQVVSEKVNNEEAKRLKIFLALVECCEAHSRPYFISLHFAEKEPEFNEMAWVKVVGKMGYKQEQGKAIPMLEVQKIEEVVDPVGSRSKGSGH
jgi:hypothetical protein